MTIRTSEWVAVLALAGVLVGCGGGSDNPMASTGGAPGSGGSAGTAGPGGTGGTAETGGTGGTAGAAAVTGGSTGGATAGSTGGSAPSTGGTGASPATGGSGGGTGGTGGTAAGGAGSSTGGSGGTGGGSGGTGGSAAVQACATTAGFGYSGCGFLGANNRYVNRWKDGLNCGICTVRNDQGQVVDQRTGCRVSKSLSTMEADGLCVQTCSECCYRELAVCNFDSDCCSPLRCQDNGPGKNRTCR